MFANEASLTSKFSSMWPNMDGRHDIQTDVSRKPNGRQNYTHKKTHTRRHIHTKDVYGVEETHVPMVCEEAEQRYVILFIICYLLLTALTFSLKSK